MSEILVEVLRGSVVESIHRGNIAVVDSDGNVPHHWGDIGTIAFMRSTMKPIQAVVALEAGIADKFGLDLSEIAIMASSHSGEEAHIDVLNSIIRKIGVDRDFLQCGTHEPLGIDAARELISKGISPSALHCTCSGKHLGQLAATKVKGFPLEDYYKPAAGIQIDIKKILMEFAGVDESQIRPGIDGCGLPVYALPLRNMALAYANLCNENFHGGRYAKSQNIVISAMTAHPEMVGGTGRFDTVLMKHFGDRLIGKFGDEGVYCIGLVGKRTGIAVKIEDGHTRAIGPVILETLRKLGIATAEELAPLKDYWNPPIKNHRGEIVGEIRSSMHLLLN